MPEHPNAGKSTLLNRIVGQKLAITSRKPQSTRDKIVGIHTSPAAQMIVFDTPGPLQPKYALQQAMRSAALVAVGDADVIAYIADATAGTPPRFRMRPVCRAPPRAPVVLVLNKIDQARRGDSLTPRRVNIPELHSFRRPPATASRSLVERLTNGLPESPFLYPEDEISTQSVQVLCRRDRA